LQIILKLLQIKNLLQLSSHSTGPHPNHPTLQMWYSNLTIATSQLRRIKRYRYRIHADHV